MKITIEDFEPLPVPEIKFEPVSAYIPEVDFSKIFTKEQIESIRQNTLDYIEKLKNEQKMKVEDSKSTATTGTELSDTIIKELPSLLMEKMKKENVNNE